MLRVENSWKLLAAFVYVIANDVRIFEGTARPMKTKLRAQSRHRRRNMLTFPEILGTEVCVRVVWNARLGFGLKSMPGIDAYGSGQ